MEKYKSFTAITNEYLDGKLIELDMKYDKEDEIHLEILYKFNDFMKLVYEVSVDTKTEKVNFLSHGSNGSFDKVRLTRDIKFETAVSKVFFSH